MSKGYLSFILLLVLCIAWGAGCTNESKQAARIMPLGDSYTAGSSTGGYRPFLYDLLVDHNAAFDFVGSRSNGDFADPDNEGHGGWVCDRTICPNAPEWGKEDMGLMQHIHEWQSTYQPDIVLLFAGINDMYSGFEVTPDNAAYCQSALMDTLYVYNPSIKIYVSKHLTAWGEKNLQINERLTEIVAAKQQEGRHVYLIDAFKNFDNTVHMDSTSHPNAAGYEILAHNWFDAIKTEF